MSFHWSIKRCCRQCSYRYHRISQFNTPFSVVIFCKEERRGEANLWDHNYIIAYLPLPTNKCHLGGHCAISTFSLVENRQQHDLYTDHNYSFHMFEHSNRSFCSLNMSGGLLWDKNTCVGTLLKMRGGGGDMDTAAQNGLNIAILLPVNNCITKLWMQLRCSLHRISLIGKLYDSLQ